MSTYYVDLSVDTTGHAGNSGDPFGVNDVFNTSNTPNIIYGNNDTYYLKGTTTFANVTDLGFGAGQIPIGIGSGGIGSPTTLLPWNAATNGPWGIRLAGNGKLQFGAGTATGGLFGAAWIQVGSVGFTSEAYQTATFNTCFFDCTQTGMSLGIDLSSPEIFRGCSIRAGTVQIAPVFDASSFFIDTVFDVTTNIVDNGSGTKPAVFRNCASTVGITGTSTSETNDQTNWVPGSFPTFDSTQAAFKYSVVASGITTPPKPGESPYTNYATGLWGEDRTGIGALYFDPSGTAPSISVQPASLTKVVGQDATFSVTVSGTDPLAYQWYRDSTTVGTDSSSYIIARVATTDAGSYYVHISNDFGSTDSSSATLTVHVPPTISVQPASQAIVVERSVTFSVDATGNLPIAYQWKKDATSISGATSSAYTIAVVATTDAGSYTVHLSNSYGTADSSVAILVVNGLPNPTPVETTRLGTVFASSVNSTPFSPGTTTELFTIDAEDLPGGILQPKGFIKYAVTAIAGETYHTQVHVDMSLQASKNGVTWYDVKTWGITAHENQVGRVEYHLNSLDMPRFLRTLAKVLGDSNVSVSVLMGMEAYSV